MPIAQNSNHTYELSESIVCECGGAYGKLWHEKPYGTQMRSKGGTPSEFEENGDYEVLRGQVRDNVEHQNLKTSTSRKLTTPNIHDGDL